MWAVCSLYCSGSYWLLLVKLKKQPERLKRDYAFFGVWWFWLLEQVASSMSESPWSEWSVTSATPGGLAWLRILSVDVLCFSVALAITDGEGLPRWESCQARSLKWPAKKPLTWLCDRLALSVLESWELRLPSRRPPESPKEFSEMCLRVPRGQWWSWEESTALSWV